MSILPGHIVAPEDILPLWSWGSPVVRLGLVQCSGDRRRHGARHQELSRSQGPESRQLATSLWVSRRSLGSWRLEWLVGSPGDSNSDSIWLTVWFWPCPSLGPSFLICRRDCGPDTSVLPGCPVLWRQPLPSRCWGPPLSLFLTNTNVSRCCQLSPGSRINHL